MAALTTGWLQAPHVPSGAADRAGEVERGHRHGHVHRGRDVYDRFNLAPATQPAAYAATSESATALTYRRADKTTLYIQTQEGDIVSLKIKSRNALAVESTTAESGDQLISELQLSARSSTKITITVDGNLNPDELAAIQSVFEQAGELADVFFAGNLPDAFNAADALQIDATQLARASLRIGVREQFTYTNLGAPTKVAAQTVAAAAPVASEPEPVTDATAPVVTDDPPPISSDAPATAASVQQTIGGFLSQLLDTLGAAASGASVHMTLKIKIFQSLVTAIASSVPAGSASAANTDAATSPGALPALLPETLDAVAAQQQPPLSVVA